MNNRSTWACVALVGASLIATVLVFGQLPARVALHWDAAGDVNGDGPRAAIFMLPAIMAALLGLWWLLPRVSPKRFEVDGFRGTWWFCGMATMGLLAWLHALLLWHALGGAPDMARAPLGGIAVFFALLGNVMGKVRRNFWLGIRTPWTLADDRVWYATHRLAAKSMVVSGLAALAALLLHAPMAAGLVLLGAGVAVPLVFSLLYYKRLERAAGPG